MKKLKIAPRERKMLIGGGIAVVLILLVQFGVYPFIERRQTLRQDIEKKNHTLKQYIQIVQEKNALQSKKDDGTRRMEKAAARLLNETVPTAAQQKLQEMVEGLVKGVEVQNRRQMKEERLGEDYQKIPLQMDIQCEIDKLVPVLFDIKNYNQCFLAVDQLDIHYQSFASKVKNTNVKPLRVNMTLYTIIRYNPPEKKEDKDAGRGKPSPSGQKT